MKHLRYLSLPLILFLLGIPNTALSAGGQTYFTDTSPGNLDVYYCYPEYIEFDIDVTGDLPTASAFLTLNAYDVDEESGEIDQVWFNGNSVGNLSGNNNTWNTTVFSIPIEWVESGPNTIRVQVTTSGWCVEIDWGQLLVDGGQGESGDITQLRIDDYTVVGSTVNVDVTTIVEGITGGNYRLEIALLDPSDNNIGTVIDTFSVGAGETVTRTNSPSYSLSSGTGTYTIQASLFNADTGLQEAIEIITFYHVQDAGPNYAPTIDLDADDSGPVSGTGYAATLQAPGDVRAEDSDLEIEDSDDTSLQSATVTLVNHPDGGDEALSVSTAGTSISSDYDSGSGVLSLTGSDSISNYAQALRTVRYRNTAADPDLTIRTIEFVVNDGTANSNTAVSRVTLLAPIPKTGFAPNRLTELPERPGSAVYRSLPGYWIEIPGQEVFHRIVFIPLGEDGWDIRWLGAEVGYLEGTAFPTLVGNTTLTAHVYLQDGTPGPFVGLRGMRYGDPVFLHAGGFKYEYRVRENQLVGETDGSVIMQHEEYDWITLITCEGYDESLGEYRWRRVVRAVLVGVGAE